MTPPSATPPTTTSWLPLTTATSAMVYVSGYQSLTEELVFGLYMWTSKVLVLFKPEKSIVKSHTLDTDSMTGPGQSEKGSSS